MSTNKGDVIISSHVYPVGSIFESTNSTNPKLNFGGTWEQIYADYDKIYLGSQLIYPEISVAVPANSFTKTVLQGSYTSGILLLQNSMVCPPNYKLKSCFSIEYSTEHSVKHYIRINDVSIIGSFGTWSDVDFREEWLSSLIEFGVDILPKSTTDIGYTADGYVYTLYSVNNTSSAYDVHVYGLMQHVYAVSNDKIYKWRRIS